MTKKMGFALMLLGAIIFIVGLVNVFFNTPDEPTKTIDRTSLDHAIEAALADGHLSKKERELIWKKADLAGLDADAEMIEVEAMLARSTVLPETAEIDYKKQNGDDFEKYVASHFNKEYFNVKEWAGDKYVDGIYADTTLHPDLLMEFNYKDKSYPFSIECKWRKSAENDKVNIASKTQLERYKKHEEDTKVPVFLALGIGGTAIKPNRVFMVPIMEFQSTTIILKDIEQFEHNPDHKFYYDARKKKFKYK